MSFFSLLVPIILGFLFEIHAFPTNQSTNVMRRWGPTIEGGYTISGFYDTDPAVKDPSIDIRGFLSSIIDDVLRTRGSSPVARGRIETFFCGLFGQSRLVINWLMVGQMLTYQDCIAGIEGIITYLNGKKVLNNHPGTILVQRALVSKFSILLSSETGSQPTSIEMAGMIEFSGQYWPQRPLPLPDIRKAIRQAIDELMDRGPQALVEDKFMLQKAFGNVILNVGIFDSPPTGLTIAQIIDYLAELTKFYGYGQGAELHGVLRPRFGSNAFGHLSVAKNYLDFGDSPNQTVISNMNLNDTTSPT